MRTTALSPHFTAIRTDATITLRDVDACYIMLALKLAPEAVCWSSITPLVYRSNVYPVPTAVSIRLGR